MTEMRAKLVVDADGTAIMRMGQTATRSLGDIRDAAIKTAAGFGQVSTSSSRTTTALSRVQGATAKSSAAFKAEAANLVATQKETAAYRVELNRLRAQFDPLFAATQAYEKELNAIAEAERMGALSAETATAARVRAKAGFDAVAASTGRMAKSAGKNGYVMRNLAFQLNQIGQQGAVTGNYLGALSIQLPDILAAFGLWGILIGGVTAVLGPMALELMKGEDAAAALDERLQKLEESSQAVTDHLKILRDTSLATTFGSMSSDIKALTEDLLALDRAAELKNLETALDTIFSQNIDPSLGQDASLAIALGAAPMPGMSTEDFINNTPARRENYADLTDGRGPNFDAFEQIHEQIMDMARSGDIEGVTAQMKDLIASFTAGGSFTDLNDELIEMLTTLGQVAVATAEVEASFNGSADQAVIDREIDKMLRQYREQAELTEVIRKHGEESAEVEELRERHAYRALKLRLEELGVLEGTADEERAIQALTEAMLQERIQHSQARQQSIDETMQAMQEELALGQATLIYGERSIEVEQLRTEQAQAALRTKLEELGATEAQIVAAESLLDVTRKALREQERAEAEARAGQSLEAMAREAEIAQAILDFGRASLRVKRMQIDAAREEYRISLERLDVAQSTRDALMAQWERTNGLESADPFGLVAASQGMLKTHSESIAALRLEQALIGQTEEVKRRTLALYDAELEIRRAGIEAESALAEEIRDRALAESDVAAEIERQADAWEKVESASGSAIDKIVDELIELDFEGVFDSLRAEITKLVSELAIKNPLKNALIGSDLPTLSDMGGLQGIWTRLTGQETAIDPASAARQAAQSVATMQVTAANVTISTMSNLGLSGVGSAAGNINGALGAGAVQQQIASFFTGKGLAPHQVAGILGNVFAESGFNPLAIGDGGTSFGLFQHHGARGRALLEDVGGRGGLGDIEAQLEHVWKELLTSESGVLQKLLASTDVQGATAAFIGFERPQGWSAANPMGGHNWAGRLGAAEQAMAQFSSATLTATQDLGTLGTGFDSFGQALSAALAGGGGLGGAGGGGGLLSQLIGPLLGSIGIPGFRVGGPTGGSDPSRVAGVVHEGEYVFDAVATARIGVDALEAIRSGRLPGYQRGGPVAAPYPHLQSPHAPTHGAAEMAPVINIQNTSPAHVTGELEDDGTDERGRRQYRIVMAEAVAAGLSKPGGSAQKALGSIYGVKKRGVPRG